MHTSSNSPSYKSGALDLMRHFHPAQGIAHPHLANAILELYIFCVIKHIHELIRLDKLDCKDCRRSKLITSFNLLALSIEIGPLDLMPRFHFANATRLANAIAKPP